MKNKLLIISVLVAMMTSCDEGKYFVFDDVVCVSDFPAEFTLCDPEILDFDAIGIQGLEVFEDFVILSCHDSRGCLSVFDKEGRLVSKPFINIGRGPGEILYMPFISWFNFYYDDGQIIAGLSDFKGNYVEYDINRSLDSGLASWKYMSDSLSMSSGARYFRIGANRLLCRKKNGVNNGFVRFEINEFKKQHVNDAMVYLNSITSSDSNLLSTLFLVNGNREMVAELGSRLSVVHVYSLDTEFKRTIAFGDRLEDIRSIEAKKQDDMPKSYYEGKAFDDFFVGLYLGTVIRDLDEDRFPYPQLHLFSWDGKPLARLHLPVKALYFDLDILEKKLYVVENDTEKILRFDISDVLDLI